MITVTGASGHFGRLAVQALIERGVPAAHVAVVVRTPEKVADLAALGVDVRQGDYSRPETLPAALVGTERLLLVSSSEVGQRLVQHQNVIAAAVAAGVRLIAYTSILNADTNSAQLADEHRATEQAIRASGIPYSFLRNGWYLENYTANLAPALQFGTIYGSAGDGLIAGATRADLATAAAVVVAGPGHENTVYELGGDEPFTMSRLAAEVSAQAGTPISYTDVPTGEYVKVLVGAGLPQPYAEILADSDQAIARGDLTTTSRDLRNLIGRPTTSLADAVATALKD
ncbi:MAG TPA: SDR family oxidoreductase [Actinoplanes sp.]|nr:SDR family oxidoreductase [Actinoplanes sp.]